MNMRKYILFIMLATPSCEAKAGLSRLEALSMIETGDNDRAVGRAGEISRYQIKPWIWRKYSRSYSYTDRRTSGQVAEKHLTELKSSFRHRTKREPSNFDLYVLWNAGPTYYAKVGFSKTRVHPIIRERAQRFANLCHVPEQTLVKVTPQKAALPIPALQRHVATGSVQPKSSVKAGVPWPVFGNQPGSSLQDPMFQMLPLTSRPAAAMTARQPIFAIGGVKAD